MQTEDSGVENPHIYTHIFQGGVILSSRKLDYDAEAAQETVKALMQAQHKAVLKDLKRGAFDGKIDQYFGDQVDDAAPAGGEAPIEGEEATSPGASEKGRASTEEDTGVPAAMAEVGAPAADGVPRGERPEESDATERMERVPDDVAAAFDAVQEESTSPASEVEVTWRPVKPPPIPQAGRERAPPSEPPRSQGDGVPRVPHPDDRPGSYRRRRPSRDVVDSPRDAAATTAADSRPNPRAHSAGDSAERKPRAPQRPSPVVVSRPSVIVGGPAGEGGKARGSGEAGASRPADKRKRESLFGQDLISEKSLDEVILAYLSEDAGDE